MAWSTPKEWSGDELLTASDLNQYVSDNLSALYNLVQGGGRKNLLHNGAMQVAQRGTSTAGLTSASGQYYTADRWNTYISGVGTWTQTVESDAPTGSGFRKSLKWLITANHEATVGAADYVLCQQIIEGQNAQSVKKGTSSAEPLTLSFWTKSNKTGTYIVELHDLDNTRTVSASYTIASSGTWEQQTVTFPADTTGALDNDNSGSLVVAFYLAAGTNLTSGTLATTWGSVTAANRAVGQTNLAAATNNYWQVTGVQLEVGSAATGFEHKSYGQELSECQRYYFHAAGAGYQALGNAYAQTSTAAILAVPLPSMRIAPASIASSNLAFREYGATYRGLTGVTLDSSTNTMAFAYGTVSGATAGHTGLLVCNNGVGYIGFSADL